MNPVGTLMPYCGPSPLPSDIWLRWNFDPALLVALAFVVAWHGMHLGVFMRRAASATPHQRLCFYAGWSLLTFGFISPLCALGVALFSARVLQHMWLALIAAPLLVLAHRPAAQAHPRSSANTLASPMTAAGLFAIALWGWHLPRLYEMTLQNTFAYWLMHLSITATAVLLWSAITYRSEQRGLARIGAAFATLVHMGLLGALIAVAPRLLYRSHVATAPVWGFAPVEDQQLGGLIMWVPASAVFLLAMLAIVYTALRPHSERANPR